MLQNVSKCLRVFNSMWRHTMQHSIAKVEDGRGAEEPEPKCIYIYIYVYLYIYDIHIYITYILRLLADGWLHGDYSLVAYLAIVLCRKWRLPSVQILSRRAGRQSKVSRQACNKSNSINHKLPLKKTLMNRLFFHSG
jgi:hypothetical protein